MKSYKAKTTVVFHLLLFVSDIFYFSALWFLNAEIHKSWQGQHHSLKYTNNLYNAVLVRLPTPKEKIIFH